MKSGYITTFAYIMKSDYVITFAYNYIENGYVTTCAYNYNDKWLHNHLCLEL